MARPASSYRMYSASIYSANVEVLTTTLATLPEVAAWCAHHFINSDSYGQIRRRLQDVGMYSRAYKTAPNTLISPFEAVFVLITLAKEVSNT